MRTPRTLILGLLAAVLSIALAACGSPGSGDQAKTPASPEPTGHSATHGTSKATPASTGTPSDDSTLPDICAKVPDTKVSEIMGHGFTGANTDGGGSHACQYTPRQLGPIMMLIVFRDKPGQPYWKQLTHKTYRPVSSFTNVTDAIVYKPGSYTILKGDLIIDIQLAPLENPADDAKVKKIAQYAADNL